MRSIPRRIGKSNSASGSGSEILPGSSSSSNFKEVPGRCASTATTSVCPLATYSLKACSSGSHREAEQRDCALPTSSSPSASTSSVVPCSDSKPLIRATKGDHCCDELSSSSHSTATIVKPIYCSKSYSSSQRRGFANNNFLGPVRNKVVKILTHPTLLFTSLFPRVIYDIRLWCVHARIIEFARWHGILRSNNNTRQHSSSSNAIATGVGGGRC